MITPQLLYLLAHADGEERAQAFSQVAAAAGEPAAYHVVVATLTSTPDEQVAFWCLDALIKQFGDFLPADAPRLLPLLLARLVGQHPPVTDRAIWALNVVGPASVAALLDAIQHASSSVPQRVAYVFALARNKHVHPHIGPVVSLLAQLLQDAEATVRYWAMVAVMDLSPLRPFYRPPMPTHYFEPLYPLVIPVAQEFMAPDQDGFAGRYHELITQYGQSSIHKDKI
ncbi:hypothetical protein GO988_23485 [Hymenobacter sp. HMF4947]|uniref:HEAT repeat domain-containing protein n=1 Tax=Hymenobacter ginkgonis TaxID=2682976 RepID=A0A7K1TLS5_9BACT|nr:hypothetical protein [Hymenobacter ginkgonis]MVN79306.1 hypothetical protein [Hymenobacter ginkgonis]